jgi:GNAT superfamily N-acetyltransferase
LYGEWRAVAYDVVNLTKMLIQAREEKGEQIYYPSVAEGELGRQMVSDHVRNMTKNGVVYVADLDGRLLGAIGMHVTQMAEWSPDWGLINEWFYVLPKFRDSDIAIMLLKAVEEWADADINPWNNRAKPHMPMVVGMMSAQQIGLKNKFMQGLGYDNGGGNFVRAPRHEQFIETDDNAEHSRVA